MHLNKSRRRDDARPGWCRGDALNVTGSSEEWRCGGWGKKGMTLCRDILLILACKLKGLWRTECDCYSSGPVSFHSGFLWRIVCCRSIILNNTELKPWTEYSPCSACYLCGGDIQASKCKKKERRKI